MIRPDLDLVRTIADAVAVQEGRRGGSVSAHTLALEAKTVIAYTEHLEAELKRTDRVLLRQRIAFMLEEWNANLSSDGAEVLTEATKRMGHEFSVHDLWEVGLADNQEHATHCSCRYAMEDRND